MDTITQTTTYELEQLAVEALLDACPRIDLDTAVLTESEHNVFVWEDQKYQMRHSVQLLDSNLRTCTFLVTSPIVRNGRGQRTVTVRK